MKLRAQISQLLSRACVYFTVLALSLYTGGILVSGFERQWIPTVKMMYMAFVFSLLFSALHQFVLLSSLPGVVKLLIHYPLTLLIFYVIFVLWGGGTDSSASLLVILLAFSVLYAIAALIRFLIRYLLAAQKNSASAYQKQFRKE